MFWRNFRRELRYTATRLVSVIIITMVAVMLYVGFACLNYNVNQLTNRYYDQQNVADYWITGQNFNRTDCDKLLKIPGVGDVQPRTTLTAESRYDSDTTVLLYAVPKEMDVNVPRILEGNLPSGNGEMMISRLFAQAQGLQVGDDYEMKIPGTGQFLKMTVCALVQDPECMYNVDSKNLTPDYSKHGFAYLPEGALSSLFGKNLYNQICITTDGSADENAIRSGVNDALGTKVINIVALKDYVNAYEALNVSNSIKSIILIFPLIFFAVAALIMFSTMSRLVENARMSVGTFKALGYEDSKIMAYYLLYAVLVVNVGFLLGMLPVKAFTLALIQKIFNALDFPSYTFIYDWPAVLTAYLITCGICIGTAFVVTERELRDTPTECMRPKNQKAAGKNFLERIGPLWNRMGFTSKYIVRNIFRNKMRMLICIVGVAGCMMLIMTAFAIMDSISAQLNLLDGKAQKFDLLVTLKTGVTDNQYQHLEELDGVTEYQTAMTTGVKLYSPDRQYTSYVTVTDDQISLKLIDPHGPTLAHLPVDGVILDQKIADGLGVSVGETIQAKFYGDNRYYEMRVASIVKSIDGAYISRTYWRGIGKGYTPTTLYLKTQNTASLTQRLNDFKFVDSVQNKSAVMAAARSSVMSIVSIVTILIAFGGLLAFVVLYNLGIVSFFEQIRSLATLMVLGFYDREIRRLVLTENILFTLAGTLIGAPLGLLMAGSILGTIDMMNIQTTAKPLSYVFSGLLTLTFALIVNAMLGRQMRKIDMLGALKSVE